jgi:hypothetical protein
MFKLLQKSAVTHKSLVFQTATNTVMHMARKINTSCLNKYSHKNISKQVDSRSYNVLRDLFMCNFLYKIHRVSFVVLTSVIRLKHLSHLYLNN